MPELELAESRILVVDDDAELVSFLQRLLAGEGYRQVRGIADPRHAPAAFTEFQPDLVLLDWMMPGLNGLGVLRELQPLLPEGGYLPIVVLTADQHPATRQAALTEGAIDFITKPFDIMEVVLRVRNQLQTRRLYLRLQRTGDELRRSNHDLRELGERLARDLGLPLRAVQQMGERLLRDEADRLSVAGRDQLRDMVQAVTRMQAALDEVLTPLLG